jgi:hypothetical protein
VDGTARAADGDYDSTSGTLSFGAGVATRTFSVPIHEDALDEGDEDVQLLLENAVGAFIGTRGSATLTIRDNDVGGVVAFESAVVVGAESQGQVGVTVRRLGGTASGVMVDYATVDGTGQDGLDYQAAGGTLTFAAGQTTASFMVPLLPDDLPESSESVILTLSNVRGGATLGVPASATLAIVDDDGGAQP